MKDERQADSLKVFDLTENNQKLIIGRDVSRILLLTPFRANDSRWKSILFTPASLLLASGLEQVGFKTEQRQIPLPFSHKTDLFSGFDAIGLTLFEDLATDYPVLIESIRLQHNGLLMVGGPMASRLPKLCLSLFPEIDLLLRGEAEEALAQVLIWLKAPAGPLPATNGLFIRSTGTLFSLRGDKLCRPQQLDRIRLNYNLLRDDELTEGLELNISRGCPRSCLFCCHIQGRNPRQLSPAALSQQLATARRRIERITPIPPRALSININDDDLLLQPEYAMKVLDACSRNGFRLWGLQTAVDSFFDHHRQINTVLLNAVSKPELYQDRPLLWLGSDAFLPARSRRLGKVMPPMADFIKLLEQFEQKGIRHYHYWISSDHESDWPEFFDELLFIQHLRKQFPRFGLLAHAPFLIPYPDTPLWRQLERKPDAFNRIRFAPPIKRANTSWRQALRVEPVDAELTRLLDNQADQGGIRFFEALKENDEFSLYNRVYNGLREARLRCQNPSRISILNEQTARVAEILSGLI